MRKKRIHWKRASAAMLTGMLLINVGDCLPKDYFYRFGGAGRTSILDAFAQFVFGSITDTLFPGTDETDTTTTTTTGG
ncbi:MAG TPA: hypothetical protein P5572_15700 [Phycisphaerae bacterium]|nr:hypothetical protein [Phycisphaerales bacterium]HRX86466.1 hypothetical protein [Phycisphaerae bacterium]